MAGSVTITVALFGAFRDASPSPIITVQLPSGAGISAVRQVLLEPLGELVNHSALADATRILPSNFHFENDAEIAILPPVCGG